MSDSSLLHWLTCEWTRLCLHASTLGWLHRNAGSHRLHLPITECRRLRLESSEGSEERPWSSDTKEVTTAICFCTPLSYVCNKCFISVCNAVEIEDVQITVLVNWVEYSFSSLSYNRSNASSKASSPHSAIYRFLLQMRVSSPVLNHLTPNGHYMGRTAQLTSRCWIYIFIQQIYVLNILNMPHYLRFFLFKMPFMP